MYKISEGVKNATVLSRKCTHVGELMLKAGTLSGEESDRLIRYQTTLEMRQFSVVGNRVALLHQFALRMLLWETAICTSLLSMLSSTMTRSSPSAAW